MHAAEKYVLGELSEELREEYEQHYLDCVECAQDVRAAVVFVANTKEVFREEPALVPSTRERQPKPRGWAGWLKPLIAVPAIAMLIVALVYEKHHTPSADAAASGSQQTLVASNTFSLRGDERGEGDVARIPVRAGEAFGLRFDFTPKEQFPQYAGELKDEAGNVLRRFAISGERFNKEVSLVVPGGILGAGKYHLDVYQAAGTPPQTIGPSVETYAFQVEIIP